MSLAPSGFQYGAPRWLRLDWAGPWLPLAQLSNEEAMARAVSRAICHPELAPGMKLANRHEWFDCDLIKTFSKACRRLPLKPNNCGKALDLAPTGTWAYPMTMTSSVTR